MAQYFSYYELLEKCADDEDGILCRGCQYEDDCDACPAGHDVTCDPCPRSWAIEELFNELTYGLNKICGGTKNE